MSTLALLLIGVLAASIAYGKWRWTMVTRNLRAHLEAGRLAVVPHTVDLAETAALPDVVQRYLRLVLEDGQPLVSAVHVQHRGNFNTGTTTEQWKPFASEQRVITRRPGFDWDGRVRLMPGISVHVHDAYVAGEGILHAALAGLFTVAQLRGTGQFAEGELMRFLAEAAWYPTALLPGQGVQWEAVDERSARATLVDGALAVTLLFGFDDAGLLETVQAEARGRMVGKEVIPTPWQGRFWNYQKRGQMLVPLDGEVAWLLPEGPRPYWRGQITGIRYESAP